MLRLIPYEMRKVFQRPLVAVLLLLLLIFHLALLWRSGTEVGEQGYSAQTVAEVYADHSEDPPEEFLAWIDLWLETQQQTILDNQFSYDESALAQLGPLYTQRVEQQVNLFVALREQVAGAAGYADYLSQMETQAEQMRTSTLFAQPNTFSYRNILSIPAAYAALEGLEVPCADSSGVKAATDSPTMTVCLFFSVVLITLQLSVSERESGAFELIRPTRRGGKATICAKLCTLAILLFLLTALFFISSLGVGQALFGLGDLSRPIQSLTGYLSSPYRLSVGAYLLLSFGAKYMALLGTGIVFLGICILLRHLVTACLAESCLMLAGLLFYRTIGLHTIFAPLSRFNLFAPLDTSAYFRDYQNMNCFGWPVSAMWAVVGMTALTLAGGTVLCILLWERDRPAAKRVLVRRAAVQKCSSYKRRISVCLLGHESWKLWIMQRGLLLLVVLAAVQWISYRNFNVPTDAETYYYQKYSAQLSGAVSAEHDAFVQDERSWYDEQRRRSGELLQQADQGLIAFDDALFQLGEITKQLDGESGFQRAEEQYQRIAAYRSPDVRYLDTTGYDALLNDRQTDVVDAGKLLLVLTLSLSAFFSMEYTCSTRTLIQTTRKGWRAVSRCKLAAASIFALAAWLLAFLPRLLLVFSHYDLPDSGASAVSLAQFAQAPMSASIAVWLLLVLCVRVLSALCASGVVLLLSAKAKNAVFALLLSMLILLLPVATNLLGVTGEWGLLPFLTGHFWLAG